jgi:molecular chaperone GrpE (heat shock protein)
MPDDPSEEINFADEMQQLAHQASQPKQNRAGDARLPVSLSKADKNELLVGFGEMVRPLAVDLEGIRRAGTDHNMLLTALGKTLTAHRTIPQSLETLAQQMQRLQTVESANQKLFDALHAELKGYKDNFLFDALQKPFIRDLVQLFDDLSSLHTQTEERLTAVRYAGGDIAEQNFLFQQAGNLENQVHHLLEIFLRMEVTVAQSPQGAAIDKKLHRAVSIVAAASVGEDSTVARSVRPGFIWRERVVRPEDVVMRRWTAPIEPPVFSMEDAPKTVRIDLSATPAHRSENEPPLEGSGV